MYCKHVSILSLSGYAFSLEHLCSVLFIHFEHRIHCTKLFLLHLLALALYRQVRCCAKCRLMYTTWIEQKEARLSQIVYKITPVLVHIDRDLHTRKQTHAHKLKIRMQSLRLKVRYRIRCNLFAKMQRRKEMLAALFPRFGRVKNKLANNVARCYKSCFKFNSIQMDSIQFMEAVKLCTFQFVRCKSFLKHFHALCDIEE